MPPEAPGRAARLSLRQPAEQMLPGSEPISTHRAGASSGRESRRSPACQGCADRCQPAKAPGRRASPSLPATPHLERAARPPRSPPKNLPPVNTRWGTGPASGARCRAHPSHGAAGSQAGRQRRQQGRGPACPRSPRAGAGYIRRVRRHQPAPRSGGPGESCVSGIPGARQPRKPQRGAGTGAARSGQAAPRGAGAGPGRTGRPQQPQTGKPSYS